MWHQWSDLHLFTLWHDSACAALGIPHAGYNAATGELDEAARWTTAYTRAVIVAVGDVRAVVEPDVAELIPTGLGLPCDPPPSSEPDDTIVEPST